MGPQHQGRDRDGSFLIAARLQQRGGLSLNAQRLTPLCWHERDPL